MKKCPHCQGNQFKAIIKRPGAIELNDDGATIVKEVQKFAFEVVECLSCHNKVTNTDLVEDVFVCDSCKQPVKKEDMIDNLCPVCHAMKNRPDLAGATTEDLIRKLLALEKASVTSTPKIEKKLEESVATEKAVEEKHAAAKIKAQEKASINPVEDEEAKKRSEAAKKAAETRRINAEKKKAEAKAKAQAQTQEVVVDQTPNPGDNTPADLPMGEEVNFNDLTPPEFGMEDPF